MSSLPEGLVLLSYPLSYLLSPWLSKEGTVSWSASAQGLILVAQE